jgi:hypothetical protein
MIEALTSGINALSDLLSAFIAFAPKAIAACAVASAFLPPPDQPGLLARVHKAMNALAFNFGHAQNK